MRLNFNKLFLKIKIFFARLRQANFLNFYSGHHPFWSCEYILDSKTMIVVTIQSRVFRGGYCLDFRGCTNNIDLSILDSGWLVEFFCENEGIISSKSKGKWATSYYAYLNTKLCRSINQSKSTLTISTYWKPGMGALFSNFSENVNIIESEPPSVAILDTTTIQAGNYYALSSTEIGNPTSDVEEYIYIYQDAAYLWFPRGTQETVVPFIGYLNKTGLLTIHYSYQGVIICDDNKPLVISGNIDFINGVCAALLSVAPSSRVGNIDRYIGFEIQTVVDGVTYTMLDKEHPLTCDHRPAEYIYSCADSSASFMRNLFFWTDGSLDSYEVRKSNWGRIMLHQAEGFQTEAEITALLGQQLSELQRSLLLNH